MKMLKNTWLWLLTVAFAASANAGLKDDLKPFLTEYCLDCHDDSVSKGDLDILSLSEDLSDPVSFAAWELIQKRVADGEMPPKKKNQPGAKDKHAFVDHLKPKLIAAERAIVERDGRVALRRLTRQEYEYTLHDLLGIDIPLVNLLPADGSAHGFETVSEAQQLSHFHLGKYLNAADVALDEAFGRVLRPTKGYKRSLGNRELTGRSRGNYRGPQDINGRIYSWAMAVQFSGRMPATRVPASGWYRITIKNLSGENLGNDGAVWGTLRTGACSSNEPLMYPIASVEATGERRDQVFVGWMRKDHMLEFKPWEGGQKRAGSGGQNGGTISYAGRDLKKQGYMGFAFDRIEIERIHPTSNQWTVKQNILPGVKLGELKSGDFDKASELRSMLYDFANRAFRMPVRMSEITPYYNLAAAELKGEGGFISALKTGYRAILCSPRFMTFVEKPGRLDSHAIANRLSYMIWNSLPDKYLRNLADSGDLYEPETVAAELDRMLKDRKADRFYARFTDQWLKLSEIDFTQPDTRRYRYFDPVVQDSIVQETRRFLRELVEKDLSVKNFLISDFAMLNSRLKEFYGMKGVDLKPGKGLQKVSVPAWERSGLVTQGSVLKVTADGSITSPILRGVWVNERILGMETPPPPPNVPAVEPDIRGATSIRDQLEKHRSNDSCAGCHAKIDPAGVALESFDPVGRLREWYGRPKKSAKVDPSGETPEGIAFSNIDDWKKVYVKQPDLLAHAFAKHLLTYATGAAIRISDEPYLEEIVHKAEKKRYGLKTILHAAVESPVFLTK